MSLFDDRPAFKPQTTELSKLSFFTFPSLVMSNITVNHGRFRTVHDVPELSVG